MFKSSAKIIADSINGCGDRLTTFVMTYHRMIHSEMLTHRQFSRNSSSSRAIPVKKMIEIVEDAQIEPIHWGANCKGMSAKEELSEDDKCSAKIQWALARMDAVRHAKAMVEIGAHKQIVNRLLEPFAPITVICTATDYRNFFEQRCHPDAQPEIRALADAMREVYDKSEPKLIKPSDLFSWHIPFIDQNDLSQLHENETTYNDLIKIAVGRCARVSYLNHDGDRNINDDIKLHDRLLASKPAHLSPFEHCAIALPNSDRHANFTGWQSYRNILEGKAKESF